MVAVIAVHGLIHLMGPAKAFGWAELPDLRLPVTRTSGFLWLAAAVLFVISAVWMQASRPFPAREWWWLAALPAIVLSQILIVQSWPDAKYGTPANLIILVPALVAAIGAMPSGFRATYHREVATHLAQSAGPAPLVTRADLETLPAPVRRYLQFMEVVGRPRVRNFLVRFTGVMRQGPDSAWMPSVIEQHSSFTPDSRLFIMAARQFGVPFEALHVFKGPRATFAVKVASVARVVDARGPEMDQSETVTMLNDMCMLAPASLIGAAITWSDVTDGEVRATFVHAGQTVSARLTFADDGSLVNFESEDRYQSDGTVHARARWSTPVERYGVVNGIRLPVVAEARWTTADSDFAYARFEISDIAYNLPAPR